MELLKYVPKDGFAELEKRMSGLHHMDLELFTDIMTDVGKQFCFLKEHGTALDRAAIRGLFHSVDFRSFGRINWEMLTMHIIDDAFLAAGHGQTDPENDESGAGRFATPVLTKQSAVCRVRRVKYVPEWDRLIKIFEKPNGEGSIEITSRGSYSDCAKSSVPYPSSITCFTAIPPLNMIAAAHSDMSCGMYTASLSNDRAGYEHITLGSIIPHKELEENLTSMSYHTIHRALFAGTRNGSIFTMDMSKHEHAFNAKVAVSRRHKNIFNDAVSCLLPLEDRLVCGSMQTKKNVCLYDIEKESVVENYSAHTLGVLSMARAEQLGLLVTGGFERVPFAWVYKIRDFPPWKLVDKHTPHKGHIVNIECPSDSYQAISTDDRGVIKIWDIRTFRCIQTTYGDQPAQTRLSSTSDGNANLFHFHSATYHESSQTIVSCGPQNIAMIHAIAPQFLDCCDDNPVTTVFYIPSHRVIVTGHGRSVKIWEETTGSVRSVLRDICAAELSACCADSTGRKLYVGTRKGHVTGHSITTGTVYKHFKPLPTEIVQMCYGVYRAQQKLLIVASMTDLVVYEDVSQDGRTYFLGQPMQTVKMDLMARFPDAEIAQRKISALTIGGVVCQSKHSLFYMWAKRHVIAVDLGNLNIVHTFVLDFDVACVCVLGDLPAIAVLDRRGVLHIYAVRPSILSPSLIATRNLSEADEAGGASSSRKSLSLLQVARRLTLKDQLDTLQMLSITSQRNEDETHLGQVDSNMTFDQPLRLLVVVDAQGFCWQWSLDALIDVMNLAPCSYPSTSRFTANFLRRPKKEMKPVAAGSLLKLLLGFQAHQEESRGVLVIDSMGSTKILTAGNDRRAKVWMRDGSLLGELSQGRFRGEEGRNPNILRAFYERHGVLPFRVRDCRKDEQNEFKLNDIPRAILPLLKKCARRFADVLEQRRSQEAKGEATPPEGTDGTGGGGGAPAAASEEADPLSRSDTRPTTSVDADSPSMSRRGRGGVGKPNWELWSVIEQQVSLEGSLPFTDFRGGRDDTGLQDMKQAGNNSGTFKLMKPKIKFSVRGAPLLDQLASQQRQSKLDVPAFLEHQCVGRTDLPLNAMSELTVKKHQEENHERSLAANLGLEWVVYEKALNLCGPQNNMRNVMRGVNDAVRLRQGGLTMHADASSKPIPPVPPVLSMQSSTTPRPRMQESVRDAERRAVSRLLGEASSPRRNEPSTAR